MSIDKLQEFSKMLVKFTSIERALYLPGSERHENDTEHSYHLALIAWYLVTSEGLDLDINEILKFALVHDLVEIHAGDTFAFSKNQTHLASKHERELAAAEKLQGEFPEFPELHQYITDYENRSTREAKFVYALDKVVPLLINLQDDARAWKEHGVTLDMIRSEKEKKVSLSPEVEPYFNELIALLEKRPELFR